MTVAMRLEAPAKLNVGLRVTGRRDDGHHLLDSTFVLLGLADRLLILAGCSGLRVDGDAAGVPLGGDNLGWRGLVAGLDGEPDLVCLTLEKRVPVAAGLGGGSSDAAAAWRLGRAWRGRPDRPDSEELASLSRIGADVPFLASGLPAARVTGIGERLEAVAPVERHAVLLHPPFGLSTASVFGELRRDEWGTAENDLLAAACRLRPDLRDLVRAMDVAGGEPRLTGSGPTIFTLTDDPERARGIAATLREGGHRVTTTATRTEAPSIERIEEDEW